MESVAARHSGKCHRNSKKKRKEQKEILEWSSSFNVWSGRMRGCSIREYTECNGNKRKPLNTHTARNGYRVCSLFHVFEPLHIIGLYNSVGYFELLLFNIEKATCHHLF